MSLLTRLVERYEAWRYRRAFGRKADHRAAISAVQQRREDAVK